MKSYELSFGTIIKLNNNFAEVIVDDGVEMNSSQVKEYHDFLSKNLKTPFYLLVNRIHSYTYTFEAQKLIMSFNKIKKLAVLLGTQGALMSTETLLNLNTNINWEIEWFRTREDALEWLNNDRMS